MIHNVQVRSNIRPNQVNSLVYEDIAYHTPELYFSLCGDVTFHVAARSPALLPILLCLQKL